MVIFTDTQHQAHIFGTFSNGLGPGLVHPTLTEFHVKVGGPGTGLNSKAQQVQGLLGHLGSLAGGVL